MTDKRVEHSNSVKQKAIELGFDACGISKARRLDKEAEQLKLWLLRSMHGDMHYMENYFEERTNPGKLLPGSKSVISVLLNYFPSETQHDKSAPVVSKYAYGKDYHYVIKHKLNSLLNYISDNISPVNGRAFVDSAPVFDRAWAVRSGLGWIGKNSMLINPSLGSFVFIGSLIINIELAYDNPIAEHCGGCNKCIQACPTNAIQEPYIIDSKKCISYLTIENKNEIPSIFQNSFKNRVFGCDICQDVCPWNKKVKPHHTIELNPNPELLSMTHEMWKNLDEKQYSKIFRNSAVKRVKFKGLRRNIDFLID